MSKEFHVAYNFVKNWLWDCREYGSVRRTSDAGWDNNYCADAADMVKDYNAELQQRIDQLEKQLPEEMQECTIVFEKCQKGHGHLRGTNWLKLDCPQCRIDELDRKYQKQCGVNMVLKARIANLTGDNHE